MRKRANAFLRNASRLIEEKEYDLAAFNLEQYCQLMLKYRLLVLEGSYPRTHSLRRLIRMLGKYDPKVLELVENIQSLHYIARLEEAYIASRHLPLTYEEKEVKDLYNFVVRVFKPLVEEGGKGVREGVLGVLRSYRSIARRVKEIVLEYDSEARVYVFGSVVEGKYTGASDIDILIVTRRINRKYDMIARIYYELEDSPVELHVTTPEQYERWYKRFIGGNIEEV